MTRHIRHPHDDHAGESLCGVRLYNHDWAFTSLDHAYNTLNNDGTPVPCPACIAQALQTLRAALSTPAPAEALSNLEQATQAVNRQLGGKLYQHRKGGVYLAYQRRSVSIGHKAGEFIFSGIMGAPLILATDDIEEEEEIVCYRNVVTYDGYARPARLFDDGRFTPLTLAPAGLLARAQAAEAERDRLLRSDRFLGEPTVHETLEDAQASWERHQQDMRQERRERFERRIQAALEQNPAALTYATPHGLAAYLADALTGTGEANHE